MSNIYVDGGYSREWVEVVARSYLQGEQADWSANEAGIVRRENGSWAAVYWAESPYASWHAEQDPVGIEWGTLKRIHGGAAGEHVTSRRRKKLEDELY